MATDKQIAANRLNALLSTGPKTVEGKAVARRNALTHGLAGAGIVMPIEEEQLVQERAAELCSSLKPLRTYDLFLTEEIALEQLRAERCRRLERARRQRLAEDALDRWDEDRVIAAEQLGAQLSKEPSLYARRLQQTVQGCDWLLERWRGLGRVLEGCGAWSDDQRRLALDMLGTPLELRRGGTPLDPARTAVSSAAGAIGGPPPTLSFWERVAAQPPGEGAPETGHACREDTLTWPLCGHPLPGGEGENGSDDDAQARCMRAVADEIERLTRLRDEVLDPRDEAEQRAAFHGEGVETDLELQLLHRYESAIQRRKAWLFKYLNKSHLPGTSAPSPRSPREWDRKPGAGESGAAPVAGPSSLTRPLLGDLLPEGAGQTPDGLDSEPFLPPICGGAPTLTERELAPSLAPFRGPRALGRPALGRGNRRDRRAQRAHGLT